jgi:hypothetical protein
MINDSLTSANYQLITYDLQFNKEMNYNIIIDWMHFKLAT